MNEERALQDVVILEAAKEAERLGAERMEAEREARQQTAAAEDMARRG